MNKFYVLESTIVGSHAHRLRQRRNALNQSTPPKETDEELVAAYITELVDRNTREILVHYETDATTPEEAVQEQAKRRHRPDQRLPYTRVMSVFEKREGQVIHVGQYNAHASITVTPLPP